MDEYLLSCNNDRRQEKLIEYKKSQKNLPKFTPPPTDPAYVQYRQILNNYVKFPDRINPNYLEICTFNLKNFVTYENVLNSELFFVCNENQMIEMVAHLNCQKEIAIDCEFDCNNFFHVATALIQISTYQRDFVIDPFLMFPCIKVLLEPIFMNSKILKIVFSNNDVKAFRRDFDVLFCGVVDVQDVYKRVNNEQELLGFANLVKVVLGVDLDKSFQNYQWSNRPLPENVLMYARNDTKYLIRLYNEFKKLYNLEDINMVMSRQCCLESYNFPKVKVNVGSDFKYVCEKLCKSSDERLDIESKRDIFERVWSWRLDYAKMLDRKPNTVISLLQFKLLIKVNPKSISELESCLKSSKSWSNNAKTQLINVINGTKSVEYEGMDIEEVISDIVFNSESKFCFKVVEGEEMSEIPSDYSVEYVLDCGESHETPDIGKRGILTSTPDSCGELSSTPVDSLGQREQNEMNYIDVSNNLIENVCKTLERIKIVNEDGVKVLTRTEFNRRRRLRKASRNKTDNDRKLKGLAPIRRKIQKGKKWRERQLMRKMKFV